MEAPYSLQSLQQQLYHEFEVLKKINREVSENLELNPVFQLDKIYNQASCQSQPDKDTASVDSHSELDEFTHLDATSNEMRLHPQTVDDFSDVEGIESEDEQDEDDLVYPESADEEIENDTPFNSIIQGNLSDLKHDTSKGVISQINSGNKNRKDIDELMKISMDFLRSDLSSNLNLKDITHKLNLEFMKIDTNNEENVSQLDDPKKLHLLKEIDVSSENADPKFVDVLHGVKINELSNSVNVKSKYYINELENY